MCDEQINEREHDRPGEQEHAGVKGGASVRVLFPPRDQAAGAKPKNNDSMVLRVSFGGSSVLLEGDAEKQVERRIAATENIQADVLKVGRGDAHKKFLAFKV